MIGDPVTLERSRITGGKLFLYTSKTGTHAQHTTKPLAGRTLRGARPDVVDT